MYYNNNYRNDSRFLILHIISYIWKNLKPFIMNNLSTITTGSVGVAAVEAANYIQIPEIDPTHNTVSLVVQIIIAIATLFKMFKKPKGVQ